MKLALDLMGSENELCDAIKASRKFIHKYPDTQIIMVGDQNQIQPLIKPKEFEIIHTTDVVHMDDEPIDALRKTNSSMYQAIKLVVDYKADGVISCGSTGCYVTLTYSLLKPIFPGLKPGFMPFLPVGKNKIISLIDVGANINAEPIDLYRYAILAKLYWNTVLHVENPKIGLINIGTEKHKGLELHHRTDELLSKDKSLNYVGYIEPKYILNNIVDIVLCDGYTGNILLKSTEGALVTFKNLLKKSYKKLWNWLGALFSLNVFSNTKKYLNYRDNAGAMIIGVNYPAVKIHGSADPLQYFSGLRALRDMINSGFIKKAQDYFANENNKRE